MVRVIIVVICISFLSLGCQHKGNIDEDTLAKKAYEAERNPVEVMILKQGTFNKELVSNGKLTALRKSILKFSTGAALEYLPVVNGSRVKKGQVIARLNDFTQKQAMEQARLEMENARVELEDFLLLKGFHYGDTVGIPPGIMETGRIRSGMMSAEISIKTADYNLKHTRLIAPFDGKIANLQYKQFEEVSPGTEFCTLIDDTRFEVEFPVLETELTQVSVGKEVKIMPFAIDTTVKGKITEINPVVDENGQVTVSAVVPNPGMLMEGMNVKVLVENAIPGQMVVPKSAVLLRQNLDVLFRYTAGTAYWTYVKILYENSSAYAVTANTDRGATLEPGDTVIISGNLNLAHESKVVIE